jgi:hypothetical protein
LLYRLRYPGSVAKKQSDEYIDDVK